MNYPQILPKSYLKKKKVEGKWNNSELETMKGTWGDNKNKDNGGEPRETFVHLISQR